MANRWKINLGPSKFDFATRYFNRKLQELMPFRFKVEDDQGNEFEIGATLNEISYDGSDESWNIEGYIVPAAVPATAFRIVSRWFRGHYSTTGRSGWLQFR